MTDTITSSHHDNCIATYSKEDGCEYCLGVKPLTSISPFVMVYIADGRMIFVFDNGDAYSSVGVRANYCPMCGKELRSSDT